MEIIPPKNFTDGRKVKARITKYDPRVYSFPASLVMVNLSECVKVGPPAILWCAIFLLLWKQRGYSGLLQLPHDATATASLAESGLIEVLQKEDIKVRPNNVVAQGFTNTILPMTRFDGLTEAAELTNKVEYSLFSSGLGSANVHPVVCELFSELANNAAEHSESGIGAYGFIRFRLSGQERRFECGVADGGIGIRQSIERNPALEHFGCEWAAIDLATKELVSGTSSGTRGIGLFSVFEEMRLPGKELMIHSGHGILTKREDSQIQIIRANPFPGTLVYFSIPA